MSAPSSDQVYQWATAIALLIIFVQQQLNASAGKKRGEVTQNAVMQTKELVNGGQTELLKSHATALQTVATLTGTKTDQDAADVAAAKVKP